MIFPRHFAPGLRLNAREKGVAVRTIVQLRELQRVRHVLEQPEDLRAADDADAAGTRQSALLVPQVGEYT